MEERLTDALDARGRAAREARPRRDSKSRDSIARLDIRYGPWWSRLGFGAACKTQDNALTRGHQTCRKPTSAVGWSRVGRAAIMSRRSRFAGAPMGEVLADDLAMAATDPLSRT